MTLINTYSSEPQSEGRACPCAPHCIAVKAISTFFLQPPSVFYDFSRGTYRWSNPEQMLRMIGILTHQPEHLNGNYATESFNSAAGCHSGSVKCFAYLAQSLEIMSQSSRSCIDGDFSGHGNLVSWKYLYTKAPPVIILNFFTWWASQKQLRANMAELMSSCSGWSWSVGVKCSCLCTLMEVEALWLERYPAVQIETIIQTWV